MTRNQVLVAINALVDQDKAKLEAELAAIETVRRERLAEAETFAAGLEKLNAGGFFPWVSETYPTGVHVLIEIADLPRLYTAIGPVRAGLKHVSDAKKRLVRVHLKSVNYPMITASYQKKLPRAKPGQTAKCRIVRSRRTEAQLVCDR